MKQSRPARTTKKTPVRLAITGGIGAGKSEALEAFRRHGAAVLSSDAVVHELYAGDVEVKAALDERFGTTDRGRIAEVVFGDPARARVARAILHPRVRERYATWLESVDADGAVVEIPLLYETGAEALFDAGRRDHRAGGDSAAAPWGIGGRAVARGSCLTTKRWASADFAYVNDGALDRPRCLCSSRFGATSN